MNEPFSRYEPWLVRYFESINLHTELIQPVRGLN